MTEDNDSATETPIVTDRPTDSASPLVLPKGTFQIEAGYKFTRLKDDSGRTDVQLFPDLLSRFSINDKFEARLTVSGWNFRDESTGKVDGFADINLGTKIALAEERGRKPQMGLLVDVSLPVGNSDFTSDYVIPKVLFLGGSSLTDRIALTYNVGPSYVTSEDADGKRSEWDLNYAVALSGTAGGKISLFGEVYGAFAFGESLPNRHNFQAGATILLTPTLQIDFRGGFGMVANEPDWLVGAGISFRLPY